jgi:hypothetical protein
VTESKRMRWAEHVAHTQEMRHTQEILVRKSEGKRLLGRPGHRWDDNTEMELKETGFEDMDWISMAQDRVKLWALTNMVIKIQIP